MSKRKFSAMALFQQTSKKYGQGAGVPDGRPHFKKSYGPLDLVKDAYNAIPVPETTKSSHYHNQLQKAQAGLQNDLTPAQRRAAGLKALKKRK